MPTTTPVVPKYITVHLGPPDSNAENVTVLFPNYIKNVASNEIYPTWPESAIRANVYALTSFALNRIVTQYYRKKGYNFDITNEIGVDQLYTYDRTVYRNVSEIVDGIFNDYVVKGAKNEPYQTKFCPGRVGPCEEGVLNQWGTVDLAKSGYTPYQILQYYYGNDIGILRNAPVEGLHLYEGPAMRVGSADENVRLIKGQLSDISEIYPAIPKVSAIDEIFDEETKAAVMKFQEIFNLTADGIVGKATWYKIQIVYNNIKTVTDLYKIGIALEGIEKEYKKSHRLGDSDDLVTVIQFYLNAIADYYEKVPHVKFSRLYDEKTRDAVIAFQQAYGLKPDGIVGPETWNMLQKVYEGILTAIPENLKTNANLPYPGKIVTTGSPAPLVKQVQTFLNVIAQYDDEIPSVPVDGVFGPLTRAAVLAFQKEENLPQPGGVGPFTWIALVRRYSELVK